MANQKNVAKSNVIKHLEEEIKKANDNYYNKIPTITDAKYDGMKDQLSELDPDNKLLKSIGAPVVNTPLSKVEHEIPMGSLDKCNTPESFGHWMDKTGADEYVIQHKLDGMSIEIKYDDGVFVQAVTRGDGNIGEDVTHNVKNVKNVPMIICTKFSGSLRGEIVVTDDDFKGLENEYANPRNAVSGIVRSLSTPEELANKLSTYFFDCLPNGGGFSTEDYKLKHMKGEMGLATSPYKVVSKAEAMKYVGKIDSDFVRKLRGTIPYNIDGQVMKVNSLKVQSELGEHNGTPRGQIAYKFPPEIATCKVLSMSNENGLTGRITPVAKIEPTKIGGVTVESVSLHNYKNVKNLGVGPEAIVKLSRRNDVIPYIESVEKPGKSVFQPPTECPSCKSKLIWEGEYLVCVNDECTARAYGDVEKWINTTGMDGIGPEFVISAMSSGLITDVADMYALTEKSFLSLPGFAESKAHNYHGIIQKARNLTFPILMGALNIPGVSVSTFEILEKAGFDLNKIMELTEKDLEGIRGIGDKTTKIIVTGVGKKKGLIKKLLKNGVTIVKKSTGKLTGKSFCFTGEICVKRELAQKIVRDLGGDVKTSVSKGLTYLVQADPSSQSSKSKKAEQYGTKVMGEDEFLDLVEFDMTKLAK